MGHGMERHRPVGVEEVAAVVMVSAVAGAPSLIAASAALCARIFSRSRVTG